MRSVSTPAIDARPMAALNMTPLIDVLLVLLIMFILTVPMATHKVALDLPVPAEGAASPPTVHRLVLGADGEATLDGRSGDLPARLRAIAAEPQGQLRFAPSAETRYARVDEVLAEVKRAGVVRMGFE
ncbi:ExbD/TolR family protein [Sphingomonas jatrophae]|uniref:Outer membrane transport energization protein ExbD n=1 Tax=Sphingomonas jatrophae TaxID=1166337 RepID=A0A1I6LE57_9SPHN|nr:biopolymer transporter ExbD [Sphingomonas jatrophae]SFS01694.1 outer membrane transport energization protein ExbD [Sphingomonas jatrophae]